MPRSAITLFAIGTVGAGALDRVGAAVAQQLAAVDIELIAFGVAAEIVQNIQDQNACVVAGRLFDRSTRRSNH